MTRQLSSGVGNCVEPRALHSAVSKYAPIATDPVRCKGELFFLILNIAYTESTMVSKLINHGLAQDAQERAGPAS